MEWAYNSAEGLEGPMRARGIHPRLLGRPKCASLRFGHTFLSEPSV